MRMTDDQEIGARLKLARQAAGFRSAKAAAESLGVAYPTYAQHENGTRGIVREAELYARRYKVSLDWLMRGRGAGPAGSSANDNDEELDAPITSAIPNASFPPVYQQFPSTRRIPLFGQTEAGPNGKFVMNGALVADVFCPPGLENVPDAYAVRVYGTSMEPRYKAGETVWLNPQLPVRAGDDVVVQLKPEHDGDEMASYIKEFRSRSSKVLKLWQHNPEEGEPKELVFDNDDVFSVHKVVHHATL